MTTKNREFFTHATLIESKHHADQIYLYTNLPDPCYPYTGKLSIGFQCAANKGQEYLATHFKNIQVSVIRRT